MNTLSASATRKKETRGRLLEAAMRLFAENGFEKTTVSAISSEASANIAAVNYHYRDKESLYVAALKEASQRCRKRFSVVLPEGAEVTAEERLRHHVHAMLRQIFSPADEGYFAHMMAREMAEPSFAAELLFDELLEVNRNEMHGTVRELLGEKATDEAVALGALSVVAQFQFFNFSRWLRSTQMMNRKKMPAPDLIADHIVSFSLAGLAEMKRQLQEG